MPTSPSAMDSVAQAVRPRSTAFCPPLGSHPTAKSARSAPSRLLRREWPATCVRTPVPRNCLPQSTGRANHRLLRASPHAASVTVPSPNQASPWSTAPASPEAVGVPAAVRGPFSRAAYESFLLAVQRRICEEAEAVDGSGAVFCEDLVQRGADPGDGYSITRVLEGGALLEKAATNVSIIKGQLSEARAKAMSARGQAGVYPGAPYFAGALSLVFHTLSPMVPTFRSDIRYFEVEGGGGWFGGGADLTPSYLFEEDARSFHTFYRSLCNAHGPQLYSEAKACCDKYFYIPARKEHRGIGGIFFDDLTAIDGRDPPAGLTPLDLAWAFTADVAEAFMPSFLPLAERGRQRLYGEKERQWQLLRRGRYLEFNLLYDRGVKFGMDGGGRVESIMVSAPPLIAWKYNVVPEPSSREAELVEVLKKPRDWA